MSLFLKTTKYKNGKIYLSIVDGYRVNGKVKQKVYQKLGYLDDLKKQFDDPIAHYKNYVVELKKEFIIKITTTFDITKDNDFEDDTFNIGYTYLKNIFQELSITNILKNKQYSTNIEYSLSKACELLTYSRILDPGSIKYTYEHKNQFFEPFDLSLDDLYRSLKPLLECKEDIFKTIWESTKDTYNRDASTSYYDCTNYYFEIEYDDEDTLNENGEIIKKGLRKRGPEKNHRPDPIVEMGLLLDKQGFPISYNLFSGNTSEKETLIPEIDNIKRRHNIEKVIVVADRGLNCSDNMIKMAGIDLDKENRDGYIYGQSVRGADQEFKNWVLSGDYKIDKIIDDNDNEIIFKHKSRIYPKKMYITRDDKGLTKNGNKKKQTILVDQKQMVYYSQKYADKQKKDRNQMIERAKDIIENPKKYTQLTTRGSTSYINNIKFDKKTGEILQGLDLSLKIDKIKEEEKYDGYYSIVTSELNMSDKELRKRYRGLSKIEDTFKITKSELETRPVYVWTKEHIESHFLTCYIALVLSRILQHKLDKKYSVGKILESLSKCNCSNVKENYYLFNYYDTVLKEIGEVINIDFSLKNRTLQDIKKILGQTKKN